RTGLIYETLGTLEEALTLQILITILVIIIMVMHLRTSLLISALLPLAVLMSFILMKYVGVDANVVALAGIAISIGTVVDMGIILTENMLRHLEKAWPEEKSIEVIYHAASEVSPAIVTALMTTIVSFLPIFMLEAQEGRLFGPLAFTKTFILISALIIVVTLIPAFAHVLFTTRIRRLRWRLFWYFALIAGGIYTAVFYIAWAGLALVFLGISNLAATWFKRYAPLSSYVNNAIIILSAGWLLAGAWLPLGAQNPISASLIFILLIIGVLFSLFMLFMHYYRRILAKVLLHRKKFLALPVAIFIFGMTVWQGYDTMFRFIAHTANTAGIDIAQTRLWEKMSARFPGLGAEFMPTLDEGSFLLMPTTMPHAGVEEALEMMQDMDMRIASIPEVENVVGKIGRVESALDPAPLSMFENVITYKSEYKTDDRGRRIRYAVDDDGNFERTENGELIPDRRGRYFRQWRDEIQSEDDIWNEIVDASDLPGVTSAPQLQPIETRLIMLQTGMRANMGVRISGPDLDRIDEFATDLEEHIRNVDGIRPASVFADRVVGKPYLEIDIDREAIARHGLGISDVQDVISTAIGGRILTTTVENRERYPVRVRYAREYRNTPEKMARIRVNSEDGSQIPLGELADFKFTAGPMNIRSENTFLSAYVTFDHVRGESAVDIVNRVRTYLEERIESRALTIPDGISYVFEGEFQHHKRASKRLMVIVPITLLIIFLLIYFQFRSTIVSLIIFSGIALAWSGGFVMLWLYGQEWFMNFSLLGMNIRDLFQMGPINISVAVWVGFLALFGIAVDNGVVQATYLDQQFDKVKPHTVETVRETTIEAGLRRVRPCLMTTGTTLLALLPILTSPGKGSEIMMPMAVPIFGGMFLQLINLLLVPALYGWAMEKSLGGPGDAKVS
ncbi:MAG: efflux RND transporter permease subunit, partial [Thermodesulfobacteriota bacterium]